MTQETNIDDDVLKATGRSWSEWFGLLAGADMAQHTHEELIVFLREEHGVVAWWQEQIANQFEKTISRNKGTK